MSKKGESPRILRIAETASTNSWLRECMQREQLPEGSVAVTPHQTAGRGQVGNTWEAEPEKNLTFSVLLYPNCLPSNRQFLISQITALSIKETLSTYTTDITVKWPNDVYWKERKICGMLIENDLSGQFLYCSIIGIGLNLNQQLFRSDAPNPVSLTQITGQAYDTDKVLHRFLDIFYARYLHLLQEEYEEIRTAYRSALYRGTGYHGFTDSGGSFEASIKEIEPTGHLILRLRDGSQRRYAFKEVSWNS
ncbi:MAG: biotin--[acetyl-CoA-carboxylase] ligase [Tannerellaceae bacterium]